MSLNRRPALQYVDDHQDRFLEELKLFLAIPSISTDTAHRPDIQRAAEWLVEHLKALQFARVEVFPTPLGHPLVYAETSAAGPKAPTILVYGHYDVQPADPLEAWESPPFEASVRGENLYARGASDMKGQVMASLNTIEAIAMTSGLPVNIKVLLEGQEEIGSRNLEAFIASHKELLACDVSLNPDAGMLGKDLPAITYGLRGLADFELRFFGPARDLHSGLFGGVVHNPAQALCEVLAGLHDEQGRVTLEGFYDKVRPLDAEERAELARLPRDEGYFLEQSGAPALWGEPEYTPIERVGARPTLEVNGLLSGYTGEGMKTVLPARAMAKISMRLVPDQDPHEVGDMLEAYLQKHVPATIRWELERFSANYASISDRHSPAIQTMSSALETVWGRRPLFARNGGTIPIVAQMQRLLGVESVLTGFSLPDDNFHSPNEKLHLPTWKLGIRALVHFLYNMAENPQGGAADER